MSERYLQTSRLGNVIRLIILGRQTGILRAIRKQGSLQEDAEIQFIEGRPAQITIGNNSGQQLLETLTQWEECLYEFVDGLVTIEGYHPSDALRGPAANPNSGSLPPGGSGSLPNGYFTNPSANPSTYPQQGQNYPGSGYFQQPPTPTQGYGPSTGYPQQGYPQQGYPSTGYPQQPPGTPYASGPLPAYLAQRLHNPAYIPRRITSFQSIETSALDRRERQILLLIDGRRTIPELVRLTRRNEDEIRAILAHLITTGLVE